MAEQNPLAKYQLSRIGGSARRNTEGMFTNDSGNAARDARRAAIRDQRPMTYAEMQSNGMARPGPDMASMFMGPQAGLYGGQDMLGAPSAPDQMSQPLSVPAQYTPYSVSDSGLTPTGEAVSPIGTTTSTDTSPTGKYRQAALANLEAQFAGQRQSLEEDLARRGLSASSFGAGRLGDLGGQQARALASLEADLASQEEQRRNNANEMLLRLATLFGLGNG